MAIPMLAGPGAIATVMVLMSRAAWSPVRTPAVFIAITVTCLAAWLLMRSAANAERWLPKTLLRAFERVMGLLLAAVAVEFVAGGVRDLVNNVSG
jgi:multiple antibiotic resistance protein